MMNLWLKVLKEGSEEEVSYFLELERNSKTYDEFFGMVGQFSDLIENDVDLDKKFGRCLQEMN